MMKFVCKSLNLPFITTTGVRENVNVWHKYAFTNWLWQMAAIVHASRKIAVIPP